MKTAVSVIVPCYNVAPYVDECMSGLAEQTLGPMEIICVDDGSTDGTLELLYRWREKDNRLRVISQSNAGVSAARNAGLDAAEGKYVGFVDPDDRVDRRMFSRLLGAAEKNDADVVVCGCREFVEKDGVVVHEGGWSPDDEFYPEERVEQFRRGSAWCRCVGPVYNKLVRRSLVEEHSLRFVVGLKEGAFFKASPEDRETLLSGWKKWLELVGGEKALSRLDRWDQAFCRLLLDYPLQGNFFSSLRARLMSSRKGRRGAYYTLKRHLAR